MFEHIETLIPNGRFWIYEVLMMISIIYLIACGVSRLRSSFGKKWLAISICIFGYLFCVVISTANHFASDQLNSLAFSLSNPVDLAPITKDWGANFTIEKRTEYSQALARNTFLNTGKFHDYIDFKGTLVEYRPSDTERQYRVVLLNRLERLKFAGVQYFWIAIWWLLIPLLGIFLGLTPLINRVNLALENFNQSFYHRFSNSKKK